MQKNTLGKHCFLYILLFGCLTCMACNRVQPVKTSSLVTELKRVVKGKCDQKFTSTIQKHISQGTFTKDAIHYLETNSFQLWPPDKKEPSTIVASFKEQNGIVHTEYRVIIKFHDEKVTDVDGIFGCTSL